MCAHASCDWKKSRTFNDLGTQIQGLSRTNLFKDFQCLEFRKKNSRTFKDAWEPCSNTAWIKSMFGTGAIILS